MGNMKAFVAFLASLAAAAAIPAGPPAYHAPAPAYGKAPVYEDAPPVYGYEYAVADDYSKANFAQTKSVTVTPHLDLTVLLFPMAVSKLSPTELLMPTPETLPKYPTKESHTPDQDQLTSQPHTTLPQF